MSIFWPTWWLIYRRSVRALLMVQCDDMRNAYNAHLAGGEPERWVRPWSRLAAQDPEWHRLLARLCPGSWPVTLGEALAEGIGDGIVFMPLGMVVEFIGPSA